MGRKWAFVFLLPLLLGATACINHRNWWEPPIRRETDSVDSYRRLGPYVQMNSPDAPRHFVRDIDLTVHGDSWRWTGQRPTLQFFLSDIAGWRLHIDFTIPPPAFQKTGPVTVRVLVNGTELAVVLCPREGYYRFEQPVPAHLLRRDLPNLVAAEVDKLWVNQSGDTPLGLILVRAGFLRGK